MNENPFLPYHEIKFTRHAIQQMFQRAISEKDVIKVIESGDIIKSYLDDKPYPSFLIFCYIEERPLHIVLAFNQKESTIIIITTYEPSVELWEDDFKTKK